MASARSARLIAFANRPALVQFNLRIKMARVTRGGGTDARPAGSTLDVAPRFAARLEDLVGLYLSPPEHALVWCCDANQPSLLTSSISEVPILRRDLLGSTPLSDAVDDLCASVIGSHALHQRHTQWLKFLREIDRASPGKQLRVICDSQATQDHPSIRRWLSAHPRVQVQFTTAAGSGLKMVKRFFDSVIAEQLGVCGFRSVGELTAAIAEHVGVSMSDAAPFIWIRQPIGPASIDRGVAAKSLLEAKR